MAAAGRPQFGSTSLAGAAGEGRGGMGAAAAAEGDVEEAKEAEEAKQVVEDGGGGRRRRRNLSDVSVRSPRKGRTRQGKKARLVEDGDGNGKVEVVEID